MRIFIFLGFSFFLLTSCDRTEPDASESSLHEEILIGGVPLAEAQQQFSLEPAVLPLPISLQDTIIIPMTHRAGWGPFQPSGTSSQTFPVNNTTFDPRSEIGPTDNNPWPGIFEAVRDIPDSLDNVHISYLGMQWDQLSAYAFTSGAMDSAFAEVYYVSGFPEIVSEEWVDAMVSVLTGQDGEGNYVVIPDANNDESFAGETAIVYPKRPSDFWFDEWRTLPAVPVTFDYFDGEAVRTDEIPLWINPYKNPNIPRSASWFGKNMAKGYEVVTGKRSFEPLWHVNEHLMGEVVIEDQLYRIAISGDARAMYKGQVVSKRLQILLDADNDSIFLGEEEGNRPYYVNEGFELAGERYHVADLSLRGDLLMLVRGEPQVDTGLRPFRGQFARQIIDVTIEGDSLILSELMRDRHVMLDFWGTWCAPCIEEMPNLKSAYEEFGPDRLEIVGIVLDFEDDPPLVPFLDEYGITWPQITQVSMQDTIISTYQVTEFPLAYLINPSGEIIATDAELRGERLHQTLEKVLNP